MQVFTCTLGGVSTPMEKVFRALADTSRRRLLDLLHERNGQTLGDLCGQLDMARQSATQHLAVLEAANLISTARRGREKYWGHSNVSDWQADSRWEHQRTDGSGIADVVGTVLEALPPKRLVMTFASPGTEPANGPSQVTFDLEQYHDIVRLTVTHQNLADQTDYEASAAGWAAVIANLKSFLETGHALPQPPWQMQHA